MESGDDSPQFQSAARVLGRRLLERDEKAIDAWLAAERDEPREWRDAATFNSGSIYATPAELRELGDRMRDLIKPYERPTPEERPDGARRIHVAFRGVPRVEPRKKRRKS
jgi:hypothetical protein